MAMRKKKAKGIPKLESDTTQRLHGTGALVIFILTYSLLLSKLEILIDLDLHF